MVIITSALHTGSNSVQGRPCLQSLFSVLLAIFHVNLDGNFWRQFSWATLPSEFIYVLQKADRLWLFSIGRYFVKHIGGGYVRQLLLKWLNKRYCWLGDRKGARHIYGGKLFNSAPWWPTLPRPSVPHPLLTSPGYLTLHQQQHACAVQALHHRCEYFTIHICSALPAVSRHMVVDVKLNIQRRSKAGVARRGVTKSVITVQTEFNSFPP